MTEFNNNKTSLEEVHVGDHVALNLDGSDYWRLAKVTADTKTTISIGKTKFMRSTGKEHGADAWHWDSIKPLGKKHSERYLTYADRIRADTVRLVNDNNRHAALVIISATDWRKLSTDALEQIAAIIKAEQKAKDEAK